MALTEFFQDIANGEQPMPCLVNHLIENEKQELQANIETIVAKKLIRYRRYRDALDVLPFYRCDETLLERMIGLWQNTYLLTSDSVNCDGTNCTEVTKIFAQHCENKTHHWFYCADWTHLKQNHFAVWVEFHINLLIACRADLRSMKKRYKRVEHEIREWS